MQLVKTRQQEKEMFRRLNDKAKMKVVLERIEEKQMKDKRIAKQKLKKKFILYFTISLISLLTICFILL